MSYDKDLAGRIDLVLMALAPGGYIGKKMFGGVGYMLRGNMACGVLDDSLIVRVGKDAYQASLQEAGASEFTNNGRPITGWVTVNRAALVQDPVLYEWVRRGVKFASSLPPK